MHRAYLLSRSNKQHCGFVLLWTLALLVLVAVVLSAVSRRSLRKAAEAIELQDQLQSRWALASARRVIMPHAETLLLAAAESQSNNRQKQPSTPPAWTEIVEQMDELQLTICVTDEQSKVNLNTVLSRADTQQTISLVRTLSRNSTDPLPINLKPDPRAKAGKIPGSTSRPSSTMQSVNTPATRPNEFQSFHSWEQIFETDEPADYLSAGLNSVPSTRNLTLWGNGSLNLRRASPEAVHALLDLYLPLPSINRILEARKRHSQDPIVQWFAAADLSAEQQAAVNLVTTDQSTCHSLIIHASTPRRHWFEVFIEEDFDVTAHDKSSTKPSLNTATRPSLDQGGSQNGKSEKRHYRLVW